MWRKGQELARLDTRENCRPVEPGPGAHNAALAQVRQAADSVPLTSQQVETAIEQARAKVAQAEVGLQEASQSLERATALYESGAAPAKTLDDAKNNYELAQKQAQGGPKRPGPGPGRPLEGPGGPVPIRGSPGPERAGQGAVEEAQAYLDNAVLRAPMSGYITQKYLEEGELVNAGTPVLEITDIEHTYVKVFISETKIGRVHLDQEAEVSVASFPDRVFKGGWSGSMMPAISPSARTVSEQDEARFAQL